MLNRIYFTLCCVALAVAAVGTTQAQERAAAGAVDVQMTWSALTTQINAVDSRVSGLDSKLNQAVLCGKLNKLYSPGAPGADANGCKDFSLTGNTDYVTMINTVNSLTTTLTNLNSTTNTYVTKTQVCTAQGLIYAPGNASADGNGCLAAASGKPCVMNQATACGSVGNCVVAARVWNGTKSSSYNNTTVPTNWKDGDTYIWHYASTSNDYGGGQCINGTIKYFTTGH